MPSLAAIEAFLRRAPHLHSYELGDLDPLELPHCEWLCDEPVEALVLVYRGLSTPTVLAFEDGEAKASRALLSAHAAHLPDRFYAHLSPGLAASLSEHFHGEFLGRYHKLALVSPVETPLDAELVRLRPAEGPEVADFYARSYPGSFFEPVNLVRGPYLGLRDAHGLAAVAGVHGYSPTMRVASLGNIATRPDARGRGLARRVTAGLCQRLRPECEVIALNVRVENAAAIACYRSIGFEVRHGYEEWRFTRR